MSTTDGSSTPSNPTTPDAPVVPKVPTPDPSASTGSTDLGLKSLIGALVPQIRDIIIVFGSLYIIYRIVDAVIKKGPANFAAATDIVAIISPIIGGITTIAAAAFGVAAGAAVGAATGKAAADTAKEGAETAVDAQQKLGQQLVNQKQLQLNQAKKATRELDTVLGRLMSHRAQFDALASRPGMKGFTTYILDPDDEVRSTSNIRGSNFQTIVIEPDELDAAYADLQRIRGELVAATSI